MKHLIIPAVASFLIGVFGYIIVRFWIFPITRYGRVKRAVGRALAIYDGSDAQDAAALKAVRKDLRQQASQLSDLFHVDLPTWYKLVLVRRGEAPEGAIAHLMTLADTRNPAHAAKRVGEIKRCLRLT